MHASVRAYVKGESLTWFGVFRRRIHRGGRELWWMKASNAHFSILRKVSFRSDGVSGWDGGGEVELGWVRR